MNRIAVLLLFVLLGCNNNVSDYEKFQPVAEKVKAVLLEEIPEAVSIDTLYLFIKPGTEQTKTLIQWSEYQWAATEAKRSGSSDSTIFQMQANQLSDESLSKDTTTSLFYHVASISVVSKSNFEKVIAMKYHYFDKSLKSLSKYSFTKKIAQTDNEKLLIEDYFPAPLHEMCPFKTDVILKYY